MIGPIHTHLQQSTLQGKNLQALLWNTVGIQTADIQRTDHALNVSYLNGCQLFKRWFKYQTQIFRYLNGGLNKRPFNHWAPINCCMLQ